MTTVTLKKNKLEWIFGVNKIVSHTENEADNVTLFMLNYKWQFENMLVKLTCKL